jgi:hypothetical protein
MITRADIALWGAYATGAAGVLGTIWTRIGLGKRLQSLHAQWDGFKVEYDRASKGESRAQGELAGRDYQHDQEKRDK